MTSKRLGDAIALTASDGHRFSAYRAGDGALGLVVVQEIFGVNNHIRNTVDRFAQQGFVAVAPALFERIGPGLELGYEQDDVTRGRELRGKVANADALKDIAAAIGALRSDGLRVGVVGYCWGGSLAWLSALELDGVSAAVGYYGGEIAKNLDRAPRAPVMLHFGETDHAIPLSDVETVKAAFPDTPVHIYPAGHGFSCDERGSFHQASSDAALARTLPFLREALAA